MTNQQFGDPRNASHRVSVKLICRSEQKILLIRAIGKDYFNLVGWWVDLGEGLNEAIHRELFEETGLSLDHIEPKLLDVEIQQFQPWGQFDAVINVFYLLQFDAPFVPKMEDGVYEEWVWADKDKLKSLLLSGHSNKDVLLTLI